MKMKFTPENICELEPNGIFVFGSDFKALHQGGAARIAHKLFGAVVGQGVGLQGQSYAIPTMQGGIETIKPFVDDFIQFARKHPELTFYVTRIGCGSAGFKEEQIAPLFDAAFSLSNVILPEKFWHIINHAHQLASETQGMVFHSVSIKFSDEDTAKMEGMTHEQKMQFVQFLKQNNKYTVVHDCPERDDEIMNTTDSGHHIIAITDRTFAIAADNKLYSDRFQWGLELKLPILSVVAKDNSQKDFPNGQFVALLEDGSINLIWSDSCIKPLSSEKNFIGVTSGCNGVVFGLRRDGSVATFMDENRSSISIEAQSWQNVKQIEAGPKHIAVLHKDGTVSVFGDKKNVFQKVNDWKHIAKIRVSRHTYGNVDLIYAIDEEGWLYVDGDTYGSVARHNWRKIESQYDVADVVENMTATLVRLKDGYVRFISPHALHNYRKDLEFIDKYKDFRFLDAYMGITVLVDKDGEFRVMKDSREVHWWNLQPIQ